MRCFAAVEIPNELKHKLQLLQKALPSQGLRLVAPENLHFTLQFFGECTNEEIDFIVKTLTSITVKLKPFDINIKDTGAFPSQSYIKVIWIGSHELQPLMKNIQDAFSAKFRTEKDAIVHLTLARVGYGADYTAIKEFVKQYEHYEGGFMNVREIKLKSSVLTPSGPVYNDIRTFRLNA